MCVFCTDENIDVLTANIDTHLWEEMPEFNCKNKGFSEIQQVMNCH